MSINAILKQPLVHFLLLGALLFAGHRALNAGADSEREIRVDREQLLTLLQYRAKAFERERFARELDSMSEDERRALEREWLREEVLFREAKALELDRDDYVIKQRLVQKLEFITRGFIESGVELARADVALYFDEHRDNYIQPASITFTHVFFSKAIHGSERAAQLAQGMLESLSGNRVPFADAVKYGDQFAYHSNYVERSREYIAAQFDTDFSRELFVGSGEDGRWRGPLESVFGFHLVLVAERRPERQAALENIYAQVEADAREARVQEKMDEVIGELMARYDISADGPHSQ
jgi:hypothetical protein